MSAYPIYAILMYLSILFAPPDVNRITIKMPGGEPEMELVRNGGKWEFSGNSLAIDGGNLTAFGEEGRQTFKITDFVALPGEHDWNSRPQFTLGGGNTMEKVATGFTIRRKAAEGEGNGVYEIRYHKPITVKVLGEVLDQGAHKIREDGSKVQDAITAAGGLSATADMRRVSIVRGSAGAVPEVTIVDLTKGETSGARIQAGDTIHVPGLAARPLSKADEFIDLEIEAIKSRAAYLEDDPIRQQAEEKLANFIAAHPDFPNDESREVTAFRRAELVVRITNLTKRFGPGHAEILQLNRELELLDQVMEIGEKQLLRETSEVVMASDLPKENRLQVRRVAQDDTNAEVMENHVAEDGKKHELRVSREVIVWDQHIERAGIVSEGEKHRLDITLNKVGGARMSQATSGEPGSARLAIIVDGRVTSAPVVMNQLGTRFQISGLRSRELALELLRSFPSWKREIQADDAYLWLMLIDEEEFGKSYDSASALFRNALTREQWTAMLDQLRKPMGEGIPPRKIKQVDEVRSLPGVPDGEYRVIQFETQFPNKRDAIETVTLTREQDGVWRASGYFIR